jgi:hypothetical protein
VSSVLELFSTGFIYCLSPELGSHAQCQLQKKVVPAALEQFYQRDEVEEWQMGGACSTQYRVYNLFWLENMKGRHVLRREGINGRTRN